MAFLPLSIPDIGGILNISVHATGINMNIVCKNLEDANEQLKHFKETEPLHAQFEITAIYSPHPFSIGE